MLRCYPQTALRTSTVGLEFMGQSASMAPPPRILIVEDELLIALIIEEMCRELGCRIAGVAHTSAMACVAIAKGSFDAALLDVSMAGKHNRQLADRLLAKGKPFAFVTGYDYLVEPRHEKVRVLQKPFTAVHLGDLLARLVAPASDIDGLKLTA